MKSTSFFRNIALCSVIFFTTTTTAMAGYGQQNSLNVAKNRNGGCMSNVLALPYEEPADEEVSSLIQMIQDEKLARDVYTEMAAIWGLPIFFNIAESEQRHMDAITALMDKYGIVSPVVTSDPGEFSDEEFTELYDDLVALGMNSAEDALSVGALIEEIDIVDLKDQLSDPVIDNQDIRMVYENLLKGSENHIRSFVRVLEIYGVVYTVSGDYLSSDELENILLSPHNRGGLKGSGRCLQDITP